jgi:hypothetical protein
MVVGTTKEENNIVIFDGVETLSQSLHNNKVVAATENSSATLNVGMNAKNSSGTTRPPRVPKPESGVTIHTDTEDHSNHHRSSSQPRPSQPIELEQLSASKVNSCSKRSSSQPRSLQQHSSHFLEGFNLAGSFDVGAIPDPPTPSSSKSRNRRRVSSGSVLRPMSSRDVTNRGNNNQAIETSGDTPTTITTTKSGSSARRKRKTLSHVPSPLIQEDKQKDFVLTTEDYNQGREENNDIEVKPKTLRIELCHEEISPKRRKKSRQSMVIPINLPLQEDVHVNAACDGRSCPAAAAIPVLNPSRGANSSSMMMNNSPLKMKKNRKIFPGDLKSMQELRNLVRGYCAISSGIERGLSEEAKSILEITGYELPKKNMTVTRNSNNNSRAILSNRRLVIQKIAPVLTQMEKRRERDTKQWETDTNCRVTKSTKSGRYRYYDIDSNQKISSHEYKQRYIAVIEDGRPQRMARAEAWISRLDDNAEAPTEDVTMHVTTTTTTLNKNDHSSENFPASEEPIVIGIDHQHEQNTIEDNAMKQKEAFSPPYNDSILVRTESTGNMGVGATDRMDICDMSMSLDYGGKSSSMSMMTNNCHLATTAMSTEMNEIAEISAASSEDVDENQLESRTPSPTNPDEIETGKAYTADNVSNPPPLSVPSRDTESIDPDIAQAERRLWDRIDLALHEYSEEIMMISEEKKKWMAGAHPSHSGERQQLL